jgi:aquaporin Z
MYNYLVEFIGTLFFVYVILATGNPLAIGVALALIIIVASKSSGGHVNPAVSIAMASAGKLNINELLPYIIAQVLGGLTALQIYKRFQM